MNQSESVKVFKISSFQPPYLLVGNAVHSTMSFYFPAPTKLLSTSMPKVEVTVAETLARLQLWSVVIGRKLCKL